MFVTQQRYEVAGGSLTLLLQTDHALSARERQALDRLASAYSDYARAAPLALGPRVALEQCDERLDGKRLACHRQPRHRHLFSIPSV